MTEWSVQLRSALTCEIDTVVTLGTVVVNLAPVQVANVGDWRQPNGAVLNIEHAQRVSLTLGRCEWYLPAI